MIRFFTEDVKFNLPKKLLLKKWLKSVIEDYQKKVGDINFIFASDEYLYDLNIKYLNHDYYTDVITFSYNEGNKISGDIYISIDRVKDNAKKYSVDFFDELHRVMVHGVLHLLGYEDDTEEKKLTMRSKEDFYLQQLKNLEQ